MSDKATCAKCGGEASYETGFSIQGDLNSDAYQVYCEPCAPPTGKGYTLSDLQAMKEENQVTRSAHEVSLMDLVGPDVYFYMKEQGGSHER